MRLPVARPLAAALALGAAAPVLGAQREDAARLSVRTANQLDIERRDEAVAVPWAVVQQRLAGSRPDRVRVLDAEGRELASQVVDNDGDGRPDELLLLADFRPNEARSFVIEAAAPTRRPEPRVHVRHDAPRDDVAWESDRIAFRTYGQGLKRTSAPLASSGIDVWPKRVRALVLERWYAKGQDAYHADTGEGADFYDVGPTLGTGGTAIWRNDSLHRADNFASWRVVANGPIRAIVELRYDAWDADGVRVAETRRIAIDAGQNLYRQESVFRIADASAAPAGQEISYAIGVVKRPGMVGITSKAQPWAWLTGWGPVGPKNGGHGELGNAILLLRDRGVEWRETATHYLAVSRATSGEPVVHYVGAGWTASGDFPTPQAWWSHLDTFARRLAAPITVAVGDAAAAR